MALGTGEVIEVEVKGMDQLQAALEALPQKVAQRGIRRALRNGSDILRSEMMSLVRKDSGFLEEHLGTKIRFEKGELAATAFVGPQGKVDYPAFMSGAYNIKRIVKNGKEKIKKVGRIAVASVARYLEFGTARSGKFPFMTPAFDSTREKILQEIISTLKRAVEE
jgi:HK97 gp10 family phage protein